MVSVLYVLTAAAFLVGGLEKLTTPDHLSGLLQRSRLRRLSAIYLVRAVAFVELALGFGLVALAAGSRPQTTAAIGALAYLVVVTPIGVRLLAFTGECGCHQLTRPAHARRGAQIVGLVLRNTAMAAGLMLYSSGSSSETAVMVSGIALVGAAGWGAARALYGSFTGTSKLQGRMLDARATAVSQSTYIN